MGRGHTFKSLLLYNVLDSTALSTPGTWDLATFCAYNCAITFTKLTSLHSTSPPLHPPLSSSIKLHPPWTLSQHCMARDPGTTDDCRCSSCSYSSISSLSLTAALPTTRLLPTRPPPVVQPVPVHHHSSYYWTPCLPAQPAALACRTECPPSFPFSAPPNHIPSPNLPPTTPTTITTTSPRQVHLVTFVDRR